ncbi:MAG: sensor histidine kinase [Actinomycetota bacterium]|nr:sensor histidine kinase [Actinomycetota bacterium]
MAAVEVPRPTEAPPPDATTVHLWRITTAARAFVLALAGGQLLASGSGAALWGLVALALIAAACCVGELPPTATHTHLVPVAESVAAVAVLTFGPRAGQVLLVYLVLPGLVTGVRRGARSVLAVSGLAIATAVLLWTLADAAGYDAPRFSHALPWLFVGLGAGLLSALLTRTTRDLATSQAPYAAAQRLLAQWHALEATQDLDLDVGSLARALQEGARSATGAHRSGMWVRNADGEAELLTGHGAPGPGDEGVVNACLERGQATRSGGLVAVPVRAGGSTFGAVLLETLQELTPAGLALAQSGADEVAFRLETALLLDCVRGRATTEERRRLARDIHDGVAQRIVSLAYLADDIVAQSAGAEVAEVAEELRAEVEKVVAELRFSVFELRDDRPGGASAALSEYVHELSRHSDLRVHLSLDERGSRLPPRTETEVVRIAQEAIGNAHRHAQAINLWVTLTTDGTDVRLVVEDDGIGHAGAVPGHYGLHTMRERAERIAADLEIGERPDGGTVVALRSRTPVPTTKEAERDGDHRLARR